MAEDSELLRQYALERSQAAFAALVDRYLNLVYSVALRKSGGNSHRAEEIAQMVFVRLAERAGTANQLHCTIGLALHRGAQPGGDRRPRRFSASLARNRRSTPTGTYERCPLARLDRAAADLG